MKYKVIDEDWIEQPTRAQYEEMIYDYNDGHEPGYKIRLIDFKIVEEEAEDQPNLTDWYVEAIIQGKEEAVKWFAGDLFDEANIITRRKK